MGQTACPLIFIYLFTFPFLKNHKVQIKVLDPLSQILTKAPDLPIAYTTRGFPGSTADNVEACGQRPT